LQTSYDPAQVWALIFAVTLLVGLMVSLVFKRRRVWFRLRAVPELTAHPDRRDRTVVQVGGLARTDQAGYGEEFATLAGLPEDRPTDSGHR
jgi:cytochrome c biogenesis protein